jgi:hypothetical protein
VTGDNFLDNTYDAMMVVSDFPAEVLDRDQPMAHAPK